MYREEIVVSSETVPIRIDNEIIYWQRNNLCTVKGGIMSSLLVDFCVIIFLIIFEFFSVFVFSKIHRKQHYRFVVDQQFACALKLLVI